VATNNGENETLSRQVEEKEAKIAEREAEIRAVREQIA